MLNVSRTSEPRLVPFLGSVVARPGQGNTRPQGGPSFQAPYWHQARRGLFLLAQ